MVGRGVIKDNKRAKCDGYKTFIALILTSFIPLSLALSCAGIFYPYVAKDLDVGVGVLSYYTSFIWLSSIIFLPLLGNLLHKLDARLVVSAAVGLIALVFVWLSFAKTLWQFYIGAFVMGVGISLLLFLAPSTLINRWFAKRAGFLLGVVMAFTGIGGVIFSSVGGALILAYGWQMTYKLFALFSFLTFFSSILLISNNPEDKGLLPVYSDKSKYDNKSDIKIKESKYHNISASEAYKTSAFRILIIFVFLLNFGMYVYFTIPSFVGTTSIVNSMPLIGAIASSVAMAGQTISKLVFGFVGDKKPYACTIVGVLCGVVGVIIFAALPENAIIILLASLIFGAYYGVTNVMSPILTKVSFGVRDYPRIYSRISMSAALANMIAAFVLGSSIDLFDSYLPMFIAVIFLLVACVFCIFLFRHANSQ